MECPYLKNFMENYNRRNMLFKPLNTLSPEGLEQVVDDYNNPKWTKQKKSD
jgi:hypothetical protein